MTTVGLIDLDTSHARSFTQLLNQQEGVRVAAVCDGGQVRSPEQVQQFCAEFDCKHCQSIDELADHVDAAMLLSADWQVHMDRLRLLAERAIPTYIDKPIAGSACQLDQFVTLAQQTDAPILTGSGWRYNHLMQKARREWADQTIDFAHAILGGDYLYYGVHGLEALLGLLGPGLDTVELTCEGGGLAVVSFTHQRGTQGRLVVGGQPFFRGVAFVSQGRSASIGFTGQDIHQGVCRTFLQMVRTGQPPLPPQQQVEPVRALLAARQARHQGRPLAPHQLDPAAEYPSDAFMAEYVRQSQPANLLGT